MAEEATVRRWRRYGKDRLYVTTPDGAAIGWHDLLSMESMVERPDKDELFRLAVAEWLAANGWTTSNPEVAPAGEATHHDVVDSAELEVRAEPLPSQGPDDTPTWTDLAGRAAGAAAREQALALKQAAPVRTFVTRLLNLKTDERAWRIGADGEEMVASQLAKLAKREPRWRFLHAVLVGAKGSDIDHVVVGPGGVFTLNAKHHPGAKIWVGGNTFLVNGARQDYIRNSRHEAKRAGTVLTKACGRPVQAVGVVVPVGASTITIKQAPDGVHVVNRMQLAKWLAGRAPILDDESIDVVFEGARRSSTWLPE